LRGDMHRLGLAYQARRNQRMTERISCVELVRLGVPTRTCFLKYVVFVSSGPIGDRADESHHACCAREIELSPCPDIDPSPCNVKLILPPAT
jgi:hypothetical protein